MFPRNSYSQVGEDIIIENLLDRKFHRKYNDLFYIDIGTCHPIEGNNTYLFYKGGARGILVEPNPDIHDLIKKERPNDLLVKAGIAAETKNNADYYHMTARTLNSFCKETIDEYLSNGAYNKQQIKKVSKINLISVPDLLSKCKKCPDIVSIDTEGFDVDIIKSWDYLKFAPLVFCVESHGGGHHGAPVMHNILTQNKYEKKAFTNLNSIYVRKF
jgi:FkbM family methyltransferase